MTNKTQEKTKFVQQFEKNIWQMNKCHGHVDFFFLRPLMMKQEVLVKSNSNGCVTFKCL